MNMHVSDAADSAYGLDGLSNEDLQASTKQLVGASNRLLAALLAHLAEVEARGVHRERACASLYTYCVYELRLSEDSAFRRSKAARLARAFPKLLDAVARGELHLTGLLMLGPHLTDENQNEVLALAKHRTKREIAQLVRKLDPEPHVPTCIEPLGPAPARLMGPANPSWAKMVQALAGPVRELPEGQRPADWVPNELGVSEVAEAAEVSEVSEATTVFSEPQRYKVELTASQEYVDLLEEARDLLSHALPHATLDEIHVRALRALVTELKKKKYGATDEPREAKSGEPRGRHVPAKVRRTVAKRDGERCTFVDPVTGRRCRETRMLEMHHIKAHALGGPPTAKNLTLRCRAHNALAAEQDFGREFMREKVGGCESASAGEGSRAGS